MNVFMVYLRPQVERDPDAVAVVFEEQSLSYRELNVRANQLAHYLIGHGVGPEVMVGICVERSVEMVVGILGILKAGGAYVPLDPEYPAARLAFMLKDTGAPVLLTQARLRERLPDYGGRVISLDTDWGEVAREGEKNPKAKAGGRNLVYVIYTSGSTGTPKGVMVEHRSLLNYVQWLQQDFPLTSSDRVLQSTPLSFDISILELFWPLVAGARVEIAHPGAQRSPYEITDLVRRRAISILQGVPSMLGAIVVGPRFLGAEVPSPGVLGGRSAGSGGSYDASTPNRAPS